MDPVLDPTQNAAFIIFAAISPLLIAFVKQQGFTSQVNALIALACYFIVGIGGALLAGVPLALENVTQLIAIATIIGTAAYNVVWSNLMVTAEGVLSLDQRLTAATSFIKAKG
jgi:hypothetical protein